MENITRCGIVTAVNPGSVTVTFIRNEACSGCAAKNACGLSGGRPLSVEVKTDTPQNYRTGQNVTLEISVENALTAALWAYVLPLFLMLSVLAAFLTFGGSETAAATATLAVLPFYYALNYQFRRRFKPQKKIKLR